MPKSKHRHKGGGKSTKHPGRGIAPPPQMPLDEVVYNKFLDLYVEDFASEWEDTAPKATIGLLDTIALAAFDVDTLTLLPVSKNAVFADCMVPFGNDEALSPEMAEAALAFIVEKDRVSVDGDQITVPSHFLAAAMPPLP